MQQMNAVHKEIVRLGNIITRRVIIHYPRHVRYEDVHASAVAAAMEALPRYDPNLSKLITYLWRRMLGAAHKSAMMQAKQVSGRWLHRPPRCIRLEDLDLDAPALISNYDIYHELEERGL